MSGVLETASLSFTFMGAGVTAAGLPAIILSIAIAVGVVAVVIAGAGVIYYMSKDSNEVEAAAKQKNC